MTTLAHIFIALLILFGIVFITVIIAELIWLNNELKSTMKKVSLLQKIILNEGDREKLLNQLIDETLKD